MIGIAGQLSSALIARSSMHRRRSLSLKYRLIFRKRSRGLARKFRELGKFPAVTRDIAMIVPDELSHEEISDVILARRNRCWKASSFSISSLAKTPRMFGAGKKVARISIDISRPKSDTDKRGSERGSREDSRAIAKRAGRGIARIVL